MELTRQEVVRRLTAASAAIVALPAEMNETQAAQADQLDAECRELEQHLQTFRTNAEARQTWLTAPVQVNPIPGAPVAALGTGPEPPALASGTQTPVALAPQATWQPPGLLQAPQGTPQIPAQVRRVRLENINRCQWLKEANIDPQLHAYQFGMWLGATLFPRYVPRARQYCLDHGLPIEFVWGENNQHRLAQAEGVNTAGGFLVPPQFDNTLIDLRELYGALRKWAGIEPMTSDTKLIPRRTGGVTAYWPGEGGTITESSVAFDMVQLVAKKPAVLAYYSNELNEDAIISIADRIALEIAYAFSKLEDQCGFIGDGTSTYGGIVGICTAFLNLSATRANIAGLVVGTGNQWSELTLSDFTYVQGRLPLYARQNPSVAWYCSVPFYEGVMKRLALAAGGVTAAEVANTGGQPIPRFLGAPVHFAQAMPLTEANDQVACLYGAMPLAVAFGDRRQTTLAMSDQYAFNTDQIAIRGTERFDVNAHDLGNADSTAANRVPGPLVGLLTAAS